MCARRLGMFLVTLGAVLLLTKGAGADGLRDNLPDKVRPVPPIGKPLDPMDRAALQSGVEALGRAIDDVAMKLRDSPTLQAYLPDVQIYYNAVAYPLAHQETIDPAMALRALGHGMERAALLREGEAPWINNTAARGYVSAIDGSVQPYILGVPVDYRPADPGSPQKKYRLDVWGHGRDELLTELRFVEMNDYLHEHRYLKEQMEPTGKFILSLYGRYITACKFAGEIDGIEAREAVERAYPIDPDRRFMFGFSLGGAMTWQYATHYPGLWAAAAPGAGFSETPEFLTVFQKEDVTHAPWYQQTLWHLYNATDYVANLSHLPTIAYAGDQDPQKQASDAMLKAADREHVQIDRIIGKNIGHAFTPVAKLELDRRIDEIVSRGRNAFPTEMRFETWTLRYNHLDWLTIDGLGRHWQRATVEGSRDDHSFTLRTQNVSGFTIQVQSTVSTLKPGQKITLDIDGEKLDGGQVAADGSYEAFLSIGPCGWVKPLRPASDLSANAFRKIHGLQGPIDDAFMEPFLIVVPTGKPLNEKVGAWEMSECKHAITHWYEQFRGIARVKNDIDVTPEDIGSYNLVCFGDRSSNSIIAKLIDQLPIKWTNQQINLGQRTFGSDHCAVVLAFPNPLAPSHYVVLNSGFTYREYDYLNNARQTPKLPDYAVVDVDEPVTTRDPGKILAAGFFDENWKVQDDDGRSVAEPATQPATHASN